MANAGHRGMPLLSGPAPSLEPDASSCRKCNKEFNMIFARSRKCNHCGHLYCQSCTDYQALQPRTVDGASTTGYEPVPVCAFCIENLTITAAGKGQLRGLTLAKLKKYAKDYNINVANVLEKDELIDRLITARLQNGCLPPQQETYYRRQAIPNRSGERPRGILSRAMEAMSAERHAEATSGSSSSQSQQQPQQTPPYQPRARTTSHPNPFPRPDLEQSGSTPSWTQYPGAESQQQRPAAPQWQSQQNYHGFSQGNRNSQTSFHSFSQSRPQTTYSPPSGPPPQQSTYNPPPAPPPQQSPYNGPNLNVPPTNSRPRSASAPRTPTSNASTRATSPSPSIPTLEELLEMSSDAVRALSISSLKAILFRNHVNTGMIVEKAELVAKVQVLIQQERLEREDAARRQDEENRQDEASDEDDELREVLERSRREHEEHQARLAAREQDQQGGQGGAGSSTSDAGHPESRASRPGTPPRPADAPQVPPGKLSTKAQAMASHLERTGLCVICQDEEANIAIVDCGHLAMCRGCSDLIMAGSRECPLCRTRIVTEARLLRIYKA